MEAWASLKHLRHQDAVCPAGPEKKRKKRKIKTNMKKCPTFPKGLLSWIMNHIRKELKSASFQNQKFTTLVRIWEVCKGIQMEYFQLDSQFSPGTRRVPLIHLWTQDEHPVWPRKVTWLEVWTATSRLAPAPLYAFICCLSRVLSIKILIQAVRKVNTGTGIKSRSNENWGDVVLRQLQK